MPRFYTIGEVAEMTGINKRTLKYYVERKMIKPSSKKIEGGKESWLYSKSDIGKIRQIALYRELGYSADDIRNIIKAPGFDWSKNLCIRIDDLKQKKQHLENVIFAAEFMRYVNDTEHTWSEFDISDFDNDIDRFANSVFTVGEEQITEQATGKIYADLVKGVNANNTQEQWQRLLAIIGDIREAMKYEPDSEEAQRGLTQFFCLISEMISDEEEQLDALMMLRIIANLSIDRAIDISIGKPGATNYIAKAYEVYCKQNRKANSEKMPNKDSEGVFSV